MSYMKEMVINILELRMDGMSPEEIAVYLNHPYEKVVQALERWLPDFVDED